MAVRRTVGVLGTVTALAGVEHGIGEVLQGNITPAGLVIASWPDSDAFRVLSGEPALTLVPNLLVSGVLAIVASLGFLVWAINGVQRPRGGLVLILLATLMLLVGGGFGPPLIGLLLGLTAMTIHARLWRWHARMDGGAGALLADMWPWCLAADVVVWLSLTPGVVLLATIVGSDAVPEAAVWALISAAFGLLLLTLISALARDAWASSDGGPGGLAC